MKGLWVAAALLLAGCGADGPPAPPGPPVAGAVVLEPGVSVTGEASLGLAGRL